ncbi:hypothetical protein HBN50_03265 [Halobacteriovorax sp. GB3]|uniref:hypothetical protein n=1 Tax=Halobacteriovorax sp. GB3 TaxID=2719615 RepID=UPI002360CFC1|nr:hypothetical protein [Halobacteriovorax sp. GB3]MDD0852096.1 hypothetical protein [Halobacteriovorax sp. GB3]
MKTFFFMALMAAQSFSAFASTEYDAQGMKSTYATILNTTDQSIELTVGDSKKILVSKETFETEKEAMNFCKSQKLELDKSNMGLAIAMSGALEYYPKLRDLLTIEFTEIPASGVLYWTGEGEDMVMTFIDGSGTASERVPISQLSLIKQKLEVNPKAKVTLPAVCY